jgi:hypothetical protein
MSKQVTIPDAALLQIHAIREGGGFGLAGKVRDPGSSHRYGPASLGVRDGN